MAHLTQILLLLGVAVAVVAAFQRLRVPTSLGYLLVGVLLGPHTAGPTVHLPEMAALAEFGVVFLLFTIGLDFSLPRLGSLRHQVLGLGMGQVAATTAAIGAIAWLAGFPAATAFVVGVAFAQSSTAIIASLLKEQGEEYSRHGRLGLSMSVFQDVTAIPVLVVIPVLGLSMAADALAGALGWALGKAVLAFALVFFVGRRALRPLFHFIAERRSAEMFTLTVLLVALLAAWTTDGLGLSLAFGGFLAGMMLGETEFRHQVEATIRPFRDVLLGLFFVGIGMRFDPAAFAPVWHWATLGALLLLASKTLIVAAMVRRSTGDPRVGWRTGLLLAVGGEFGLALVALALDAGAIGAAHGQIAIAAVLQSMILGAVLIRFNGALAERLGGIPEHPEADQPVAAETVIIGGYGRVGHAVAVLLAARGVPFAAFDTDPERVRRGREGGQPVMYGDIADPQFLETIRAEQASLVVLTIDRPALALAAVAQLRRMCPSLPVIARARDLKASARLLAAGATQAHPETLEASLRLAAAALELLSIPTEDVDAVLQEVRDSDYRPILKETPQ